MKGCTNLSVIDLHSHLVPAVDDGAQNRRDAFAMLDGMTEDYRDGSVVVFTPHFATSMPGRVSRARQGRAGMFLEEASSRYSMEFHVAGELMVAGFSLNNIELVRYPGTAWVLVEFRTSVSWLESYTQLKRILRRGYKPLLAHPERYQWCRSRPSRLTRLSRMGCGAVASARSLRDTRYSTALRQLLATGMVHALASDIHSTSDYILNGRLRTILERSSTIPWHQFTREMPGVILEDGSLPVLPLKGD